MPNKGEVRPLEFQVRTANLEDASAIDELLQESYPKLMASAYNEVDLSSALKWMIKSNPALLGSGTFYVATLPTGLIVGCGGWSLEQPRTGKVEPNLAHIRHFATHPDWTRRGIGQAIYRTCETAARLVGVTDLECYSSLNAEKFYAALDFKKIREVDLEFKPGIGLRAVLMRQCIGPI